MADLGRGSTSELWVVNNNVFVNIKPTELGLPDYLLSLLFLPSFSLFMVKESIK